MIRVGIVGCGGIALAHARAMSELSSRVTLVAVADIDPGRLKLFAEQ